MATKEIKPGQLIVLTNGAQEAQSDAYAIRANPNGAWPDQVEAQVIAEAGNTAFSVTIEHTLDQARGWQVVATITTGAISIFSAIGGWLRVTVGTATGGPVSVYLMVG